MKAVILVASPWWVNLSILVPVAIFLLFRNRRFAVTYSQLLVAAVFGVAFGFVEAALVVYLRAVLGVLPGDSGVLSGVVQHALQPVQVLKDLPPSLLKVEIVREAATIVMLTSVALLAARGLKERCAIFLWVFAAWDIFYYAGLWLTIRWPASLADLDVLFLIPVPWLAPVWFPILVSGLTMAAIALCRRGKKN